MDHFFLSCVCVMPLCRSVYLCHVVTLERADLLALTVSFHFPIGILGQVWY